MVEHSSYLPRCIFDLDNKLIRRILKYLNIGCCVCGWKEGTCDYHHVEGRKIKDADSEYNIAMLCPNCHRLIHEKKISKDVLSPLSNVIGKRWKNCIEWYVIGDKIHYKFRDKNNGY